ncbi:AAC(3) family N-acetyltransferase [Flavobacterium psychrophilum]|uniref:AAC(3) family N-acetyltransferase n=1 Tax=Flavobacterium psychrophilum TaxID=96345 RepID=UPI000B7C0D3C|nr:AAC(3) family N-acetyltransferase [Flavobacterium psychrophilum]EKT3962650.1 AAC(3) family N-acetyltransferase [Flavobacterium psychrophilum]SNB43406.1 Aminoglycoside 3-n-acetyltransferase [Flavobacterium psychrophilum]
MANTGITNKILSLSPYLEVLIRRVYWRNRELTSRFKKTIPQNSDLKNFNKIKDQLNDFGVKKGDILVLHASYEMLEGTGKLPKQIIEELLDLLGTTGTLAMNSSRAFPEEKIKGDYLNANYNDLIVNYNVHKSRVWTGVLPFFMLKHKDAKISRFPINPIVAVGFHAERMIENNIKGKLNSSCGFNSSWKYCVDNNAVIVGLGTDLTHSLTIMHVAEEIMGDKWLVKDWFRERQFRVVDNDFDEIITVNERNPQWGCLHFAERTLCKDLINSGILKTATIDGVLVEVINSKELISFLNSKNKNGYPYFNFKKNDIRI